MHSPTKNIPQNETPSGVPPPHRLGASKNEALALLLGVVVLAFIAVGFWYQATH